MALPKHFRLLDLSTSGINWEWQRLKAVDLQHFHKTDPDLDQPIKKQDFF